MGFLRHGEKVSFDPQMSLFGYPDLTFGFHSLLKILQPKNQVNRRSKCISGRNIKNRSVERHLNMSWVFQGNNLSIFDYHDSFIHKYTFWIGADDLKHNIM